MMDKLKLRSSKTPAFYILLAFFSLVPLSCSSSEKVNRISEPSTVEGESFSAAVFPTETVDGALVLVTIETKPEKKIDPKSLKTVFEGLEYAVFESGTPGKLESLVGIPFDTKPRTSVIEIKSVDAEVKSVKLPLKINDGKYAIENLKVAGKYVEPPKKTLKRISREQKEIGKIYRVETPKKYWDGPFQLPINSEMTSAFGVKRFYNGQMRNFHPGMDLRARTPTPILAAGNGKVVLAKNLYFTGNTVMLDHGYGMYTLYAHMSKLGVKKGKEVKKGDLLGLSGATGRIQGPHLHWGLVLQRNKLNPLDLTRVLK